MRVHLSASYVVLTPETMREAVEMGKLQGDLQHRKYTGFSVSGTGVAEIPLDIKLPYEILDEEIKYRQDLQAASMRKHRSLSKKGKRK